MFSDTWVWLIAAYLTVGLLLSWHWRNLIKNSVRRRPGGKVMLWVLVAAIIAGWPLVIVAAVARIR